MHDPLSGTCKGSQASDETDRRQEREVMPRHDRAYGFWYHPSSSGGTSKRTRVVRKGKGGAKSMGRKNDSPQTPQKPKENPKAGKK